jgi:DNA-directed RNA polymerase specialized sigma24 family protein
MQHLNLTKLPGNISEHEIANALWNNDEEFFSLIYDNYASSLLGMILKWVKQKEMAEILLCKAFVKAWQSRKLFDAENEIFYCWLCRHARICYTETLISA